MSKILIFIRKNIFIVVILLIATFFRFAGLYPGYPEHTDEGGFSSALTMMANENLNPGRYDYPAGVPLLHLVLFKSIFIPVYWLKFYLLNIGSIIDGFIKIPLDPDAYKRIFSLEILGPREINVMYWGRYITAIFGIGVVYATYKLGSKIFNKNVGLIASFLVAVNFRQVLNSHIGLPDIYNSFFLILTTLYLYKIVNLPKKINYFFAGLFNGLYFSVKFQTFGFAPLIVAHIIATWKRSESIVKNIQRVVFSPNILIAGLTSAFVMLLLNPYLLQKFEVFRAVQEYQLAKYGLGTNSLNIFPLSYLYHHGIGPWISILAILGFVIGVGRYFKTTLVINLVAIQFMLMFAYISRGGFYTRNFVTITPILLIFAALLIDYIFRLTTNFKTWLSGFGLIVILLLISGDNIKSSLIIVNEYAKPWNRKVLAEWVSGNIPAGVTVAAHPDTPLPIEGVKRVVYEPDEFFSVNEFLEQGADYAISNSSWSTNSFYWWMNGSIRDLKNIWVKPLNVLEYSYPALALRELGQFGVYEVSNPWQAPDIDFLVAKMPKYQVLSKEKVRSYDFNNGLDGWQKAGKFWVGEDNLDLKNNVLVVNEGSASIASLRWESPVINIENWKGIEVDYKIKSESKSKGVRMGYIFVNFYNNETDAKNSQNRTGVRLGERSVVADGWVNKSLIGQIPEGSKYMTIGFYNYSPAKSSVMIDDVNVYNAKVDADFDGVNVRPIKVDQNNLFLNSHGNL